MIRSPNSARALSFDTPHSLSDGAGERWPVVDGIPYLRVGRETLVAEVLDHLDAGRTEDALVALLADQDDWWTGPLTDAAELRRLVRERDALTLREAMALLRLGPVADYFAYRWSDPTYLAGLALLEAHWNEPRSAFELACGIGHYLRELTRRGVGCTGADVVFAKCWLAKHWVAPEAEYLVFDAGHGWPTGEARYDLVMCHDAFYFLPDQEQVAERLRSLRRERAVLAVTRLHNAEYGAGAKGPAKSTVEWRALFQTATFYSEDELHIAMLKGEYAAPFEYHADAWHARVDVNAWSLVEGAGAGRQLVEGMVLPLKGARLRDNPLLTDGSAKWPSERYREEYAGRCLWAWDDDKLPFPVDPVRLRRLVDLPERW